MNFIILLKETRIRQHLCGATLFSYIKSTVDDEVNDERIRYNTSVLFLFVCRDEGGVRADDLDPEAPPDSLCKQTDIWTHKSPPSLVDAPAGR